MSSAGEDETLREARSLLDFHFFPGSDTDERHRGEAFLENAIRLVVFDTHLAIEELLRSRVFDALAEHSTLSHGRRVDYVKDLASRQVLDLALQLGLVDMTLYRKLRELNSLRNKAAHHWQLDEPIKQRSGESADEDQLSWQGKPLTPDVLRSDFTRTYGAIYRAMYRAWLDGHNTQSGSHDTPAPETHDES
jgi:hypothetical protein